MKSGMENRDMLLEGGKLFILASLFSLSMLFLPPFGFLINSLTPFPLILIYYLFGRRTGLLASGAIALLLTLAVGKEFGILFVAQYALMAWLVGDLAGRGYRWNLIMVAGADIPTWRLPDSLVWVTIGGGILMFPPSEVAHIIGLNILVVMSALYFLQGISVTLFFFKKWDSHILVKTVIYGIILSQPLFWMMTAFFGLADIWVDFRKIRGKLGAV